MGECRTELLPLLGELGRIASEGGDLAGILRVLLALMQRHLKVTRGMVNLRDPEAGRIFIQQGCGLTKEEEASGSLARGEGIVAQVVESGRAMVLPGEAGSQSFLCVPIRRDRKVLGAFLDEVGELSLDMQAKLLRVLQEKSFERVGGNVIHQVDQRILAATNRDLRGMVKQGRFREDLYYRLNAFPISVPPLRERGADIATLAEYFVARFSSGIGIAVGRIATPALSMLMCYHWPGNVRELENVIERAVILCEGGVIEAHHLPPSLQIPAVSESPSSGGILDVRLGQAEYDMIVEALKRHKGNMTEAAAHLGLTRRILGLRMARHNLSYKDWR